MSDIDYNAVDMALDEYNNDFIDTLTKAALTTYVFSSIFAYGKLIKKKVIPNILYGAISRKDIDTLSAMKEPAFTSEHIEALKPIVEEEAPVKYVNKYQEELMKGGRTVAIAQWSPPDDQGVRNYLGYEKRWVPWLEQKTTAEKRTVYTAITSGKPRDEIAKDLEVVFGQRKNYNDMVARTEVLNNSRIIQNNTWKNEGISKFLYVCSLQPGSPCDDLCAPLCGQIFDADNLPFGGEGSHVNCRCSLSPITTDVMPQKWEDLPVAESSLYYRDIAAEPALAARIDKFT